MDPGDGPIGDHLVDHHIDGVTLPLVAGLVGERQRMRQDRRTRNAQLVVLDGSEAGNQRILNQQVGPPLRQTGESLRSTLETEILGIAKLGLVIQNELLLAAALNPTDDQTGHVGEPGRILILSPNLGNDPSRSHRT